MSAPLVEKIANAVLYEGYILYPYRSSAVKNRQRWNFGVVYPSSSGELSEMQTECLALGGPLASVSVKVRCLRLVDRAVGYAGAAFQPAAEISVDGRTYEAWQEAAECEMSLPAYRFAELEAGPIRQKFVHPATRAVEEVHDSAGRLAGLIVRTQEPVECSIETRLERPQEGLARIGVRISNVTATPATDRDALLARSLLSAHTILQITDGEFVSLLEPPAEFQKAAAECQNTGTWPVLVGDAGERDTVLSSPIILYDYPQVAPESPGDLFDGAEIDEILSLRILALTDEEKEAMRRSDDRARRILERTETLPPEHFMKLHGALRGLRPAGKEAS
jgi:hydrogenase maturation protease